ncbi:MAG: hypothetical protein Q8Q33_03095 [Chlamydiota bacterium]|nr:hypothetical protein [Chlamydiota bacterium]
MIKADHEQFFIQTTHLDKRLHQELAYKRDTGGLHDTVIHMDVDRGRGNGFVFKNHDATGLDWAIPFFPNNRFRTNGIDKAHKN